MISIEQKQEYYKALLDKNAEYEGIFFVGIKTTAIFCRPTCSARKPKFGNCEFFKTADQAVHAGFRPCKRCQPLVNAHQFSTILSTLVHAIEKNPEKRWTENDLKNFAVDISTIRRQFKKRFGMTFIEYSRAKRMELAVHQLKAGEKVIEVQLSSGYESGSGFRDAFSRIIGTAPSKATYTKILKTLVIDTPLGPMVALADDTALHFLGFLDSATMEYTIGKLSKRMLSNIIPGMSQPLNLIKNELEQYFTAKLGEFKTPLYLQGTDFQMQVWKEVKKIPFGETQSYLDIAHAIQHPSAFRAVGNANAANQFSIIIPCHRVIGINGSLCGYEWGIARKKWLLEYEQNTGHVHNPKYSATNL